MSLLPGVATGLALVLGILAVGAWALRRLLPPAGRNPGAGVQVLSRAPLAPRQGVATVRAGGRTALVSYGEGGVRLLLTLDAPEEERADDATEGERSGETASEDAGFGRALRRAGLRAFLLLALLAGAGGGLAAQTGGGAAPAPTAAAPGPGAQAAGAAGQGSGVQAATPQEGSAQAGRAAFPTFRASLGDEEGDGLQVSGTVGTVLFLGAMTLLPTLLLLMTGFTRILIVLHLLKQALGTQTAPPAHLLAAMALLLTGFVMAPTFQQVHQRAVVPWMNGEMDELTMMKEASVPMRAFMLQATREQDLAAFLEMRDEPPPATVDDIPLVVVTSAFVTSELTSAFQMGFALFLPFVIIDVVVASVLMSMGMFMLPPVMVSLPFKLLLFVLVDGWSLVLGSLVRSF